MEITGIFKDALSRQEDGAVMTYARQGHELMNGKREFNHPPVELLSRRIQNNFLQEQQKGQTWGVTIRKIKLKFHSGIEDMTC